MTKNARYANKLSVNVMPQATSYLEPRSEQILGLCLNSSIKSLLDYWFQLRFALNLPTAKLMALISNESDRMILGVVALLDLDRATVKSMTSPEEWQFIDACHSYLRQSGKLRCKDNYI